MAQERALYSLDHPIRWFAQSLQNELAFRGLHIALADGAGGDLIDALTVPGATRVLHVGSAGCAPKDTQNLREFTVAQAERMRLFRGDDVAIATNGIFTDHVLSAQIAYVMRDRLSWCDTVSLVYTSRREAKQQLTARVLSQALLYLQNKHTMHTSGEFSFRLPTVPQSVIDQALTAESEQLIYHAHKFGLSIETIESCTGGAIGNWLTNIAESDAVKIHSWLAYDENVKAKLGVPLSDMAYGNVYSQHVAASMATARYKRSGAHIVIATTGLMDTLDTRPYHNHTKPGTVHVGIMVGGHLYTETVHLPSSSREEMKKIATCAVVRMTNIKLQEWLSHRAMSFVKIYE